MPTRTTPLGVAVKRARGTRPLLRISEQSGLAHSYIHRIETGTIREPSPHRLRRLAAALGVGYVDLIRAVGYFTDDDEAAILASHTSDGGYSSCCGEIRICGACHKAR